jgi:hypothetical protein
MLFPYLVLNHPFVAVKKIFSASRDISFHSTGFGCFHPFHLLGELCGHDASDIASGIQVSFTKRRFPAYSSANAACSHRQLISKSLGHIEFDYFLQWSDIIFLICSITSCVVLYVMHSTSSSKALANDFADLQLGKMEQGV